MSVIGISALGVLFIGEFLFPQFRSMWYTIGGLLLLTSTGISIKKHGPEDTVFGSSMLLFLFGFLTELMTMNYIQENLGMIAWSCANVFGIVAITMFVSLVISSLFLPKVWVVDDKLTWKYALAVVVTVAFIVGWAYQWRGNGNIMVFDALARWILTHPFPRWVVVMLVLMSIPRNIAVNIRDRWWP